MRLKYRQLKASPPLLPSTVTTGRITLAPVVSGPSFAQALQAPAGHGARQKGWLRAPRQARPWRDITWRPNAPAPPIIAGSGMQPARDDGPCCLLFRVIDCDASHFGVTGRLYMATMQIPARGWSRLTAVAIRWHGWFHIVLEIQQSVNQHISQCPMYSADGALFQQSCPETRSQNRQQPIFVVAQGRVDLNYTHSCMAT